MGGYADAAGLWGCGVGMDVGLMDADWEGAVGYYPDWKKVFGMTALSLNLSVIMGYLMPLSHGTDAGAGEFIVEGGFPWEDAVKLW